MFVKAIEEVGNYTRPLHTISRNYGETIVTPGAATLFFVNEMGCAVTCRHVAQLIAGRSSINDQYRKFSEEKSKIGSNKYNQRIKALEQQYNYTAHSIIQLKEMFSGCTTEPVVSYKFINHPHYDLSIIVFENFRNPSYSSFARFLKDGSKLVPGKYLCRLGFPFPEFNNFRYNAEADDIEWTSTGIMHTPRFPIDGMMTRHLADTRGVYGVEMSTPGLRGQSGGPLFDQHGIVYGMQSSTNHLHLGFDMKNFEYNISGKMIRVTNQPFLHVGQCIHVDIIKDFLRQHQIKFYEEE